MFYSENTKQKECEECGDSSEPGVIVNGFRAGVFFLCFRCVKEAYKSLLPIEKSCINLGPVK